MRCPVTILCLFSSLVSTAVAQYATGFESLNASATGTILTGQDSYYIPVAGSLDWNLMTYAGNTPYGIPTNPSGGNNFALGRSNLTNIFARTQRPVTLPSNGIVYIEYDILCNYVGTGTPANNIGSFSFQPSTNSIYVNLLARWPVGATNPPPTWDADVVAGSGTPPGTVTVVLANPAFQGLATNVWHKWGCTVDLVAGVHLDFRITNGVTNVTTIFTPTTPILLPRTVVAPTPTDFRFFAGGSDNVLAIDNVRITGATYTQYGAGCAGTMGVPTLGPAPGSSPLVGTTFSANLGNLPLSLGVMMTGFSNTLAQGSLPLPLNLMNYGFPGCNLLADPLVTEFLIGASNTATWNFGIPGGPAFVGMTLYNQGLSLDTGSPGAAFSNGARLIIGD